MCAQCAQLRAKRAQTLVLEQKWQKAWWESNETCTEGPYAQDAGTHSWVSRFCMHSAPNCAQSALKHSFQSKSGGRHGGRGTKLGLKVCLLKTPVPTFGCHDPAHAARAIALGTLVLEQKWRKAWWESNETQTKGLSVQDAGTYSWVSRSCVRSVCKARSNTRFTGAKVVEGIVAEQRNPD